jgi:hypothetical protein
MYTDVTLSIFINKFKNSKHRNTFSDQGLSVLYEHLTYIEDSSQKNQYLCVDTIADEYSEHDTLEDFNNEYDTEYETLEDLQYDSLALPYVKSYSPSNVNHYDGFIAQQQN